MRNYLSCLLYKLPFYPAGLIAVCSVFFLSCNDEVGLPPDNITNAWEPIEKSDVSIVDASRVATLFFSNLINNDQEDKLHTRNHFDPNTVDFENQKNIKKTETLYNEETKKPTMYLVNFDGGGYTIISASRDYYPVLAYSETGEISVEDLILLNEGLTIWVEEVEKALIQSDIPEGTLQEINYLWSVYEMKDTATELLQTRNTNQYSENFGNRLSDLVREAYNTNSGWSYMPVTGARSFLPADEFNRLVSNAESYGCPPEYSIFGYKRKPVAEVGPLIGTKWHQNEGFNDFVPNKYKAGCVAIAMAQIMKFHKFPTNYNWSAMPLGVGSPETARLVYDIGKAVKMDYGKDGSGSNINKAKDAFSAWGYNATKKDHNVFDVEREVLYNKRPVYMRGDKKNFLGLFTWDGHAWVCEGVRRYDNRIDYFAEYQLRNGTFLRSGEGTSGGSQTYYFYQNWGWKNGPNGWFLSNDVKPDGDSFHHDRQNLYVSPK